MPSAGRLRGSRTPKVLIVDDDPDTRELLRDLCRSVDAEVEEASDTAGALDRARRRTPDLVLLDMVLPDATGLEVLETFRAEPALQNVPVIIVSARHDTSTKVAALRAGAQDYLSKPFDLQEMLARVDAQLRLRVRIDEIERRNLELRVANERLEELATTDELTGLANTRSFQERLNEEFLRAERYQTPLSLVMSDLDGFKAVNDQHGHAAGDRVIAQVAQRLRAQARATDVVCRYGGDEFAFLLPHTGVEEARTFALRLCTKIETAPLRLPMGGVVPLGLSCGVAGFPESGGVSIARELFHRADAALYRAKDEGGGSVHVAESAEDLHEQAQDARRPEEAPKRLSGSRPPRGAEAS